MSRPLSTNRRFAPGVGLAAVCLCAGLAVCAQAEPPERKFGIAALLATSPESVVKKVRSGSEVPLVPIPPRDPAPIAVRPSAAALAAAPSAKPPLPAPLDPAEARKREIQLLQFRLNQEQTLSALRAPSPQPPAAEAEADPSPASRLLASVRGPHAAPAPQPPKGLIKSSPDVGSGTRDLQVVLAYHLVPRGSSVSTTRQRRQALHLKELRSKAKIPAARPLVSGSLAEPDAAVRREAAAADRQLSSFRVFGDRYSASEAEGKTSIRVFHDGNDGAVAGNTAKSARVFSNHASGSGVASIDE